MSAHTASAAHDGLVMRECSFAFLPSVPELAMGQRFLVLQLSWDRQQVPHPLVLDLPARGRGSVVPLLI